GRDETGPGPGDRPGGGPGADAVPALHLEALRPRRRHPGHRRRHPGRGPPAAHPRRPRPHGGAPRIPSTAAPAAATPGAFFASTRTRRYVRAVSAHAGLLRANQRAFLGYYHWQVF